MSGERREGDLGINLREAPEDVAPGVIEASAEALDTARNFLAETQMEFDRLFGQLELAGLSEEELAEFAAKYDQVIFEVENKLKKIKTEQEIASEDLGLGDIFGEENVDDSGGDLNAQESALSDLKSDTQKRNLGITSETRRRAEKRKKIEEEKIGGETFAQGVESSGLKNQLIFRAIEASDPDRVNQFIQEKIENPPEELATQLAQEVTQLQADLQQTIKSLEKQKTVEEKTIDEQKQQVREKFVVPEKLQKLQGILDGTDGETKSALLNKLKQVPEGQTPEEFARATLKTKIEEAFQLDSSSQSELSRLESEKQGIEGKYQVQVAKVQEESSAKKIEAIKKKFGENFVSELLRSDISKDVLADKLADEIYKEEKGKRGSTLDIKSALHLPESVTDALLKKYTLVEIGQLVSKGTYEKENVPAIYWSKGFEKHMEGLKREEVQLRDSSVLAMREGTPQYTETLNRLKEAESAYREAEKQRDTRAMSDAAKKYNDVISDELKKMLRIQQLVSARRGDNLPTGLKIDDNGRSKVSFNAEGKLLLGNNYFPDTEGGEYNSLKVSEHTRAYGVKEALQREEEKGGVDARAKMELDFFIKHYKGIWQREGRDDQPISIPENDNYNKKERQEYNTQLQRIERAFGEKVKEMDTFLAKKTSAVEKNLAFLSGVNDADLSGKINDVEREIQEVSGKIFLDGTSQTYALTRELGIENDARFSKLLPAAQKAYETSVSGLEKIQRKLVTEWKTRLEPFRDRSEQYKMTQFAEQRRRESEEARQAKKQEADAKAQVERNLAEERQKLEREKIEKVQDKLEALFKDLIALSENHDKARTALFSEIDVAKKEADKIRGILGSNNFETSKFGLFTRMVEATDSQGNKQKVNKEQMQQLIAQQQAEVARLKQEEQTKDAQRIFADGQYNENLEKLKTEIKKIVREYPHLRNDDSRFNRFAI